MLWNSVGSFLYLVLQWLITVLIVKLVGYEANGYFQLAMSLSNTFGVIASYGMRNYQVSDMENKYNDKTYIIARYITCLVGLVALIIFTLFSRYSVEVTFILIIYMLFKLSENFVDVYQAICQKAWRMDVVGISLLIRGVATFAGFSVTLYFTRNLLLSIIVMVVIAFAVIYIYDVRKTYSIIGIDEYKNETTTRDTILKLLIECIPLVIYLFLSNWIIAMPRYLLERIKGGDVLGIYGSIATPTVIVQVAAAYMFTPLISVFAKHFHNGDKKSFFALFGKVMLGISVVSVVGIIGCIIFGDWGLTLLFNEEILDYSYLLIPVMIVTILNAIVWFLCALLTVIRDFKGLIISNVIMFIACLISSLVLIPKYSMNGVNISLYITLGIAIILLSAFGLSRFKKEEKKI